MSEPMAGAVLRARDLRVRRAVPFALAPDEAAREALARSLGILGVRALRFEGRLEPRGSEDWRLAGRLTARVTQACVVTLDPVAARLDEAVERLYLARMPEIEKAEAEMLDEAIEPLPPVVDLMAVACEALALALPPFPRAKGAPAVEASAAPPGAEPLEDGRAKPFAALAALRERMDREG